MARKTIKEDQESRAYNWALLATLVLLLSLLAQTPARVLSHFLPPSVKPMVLSWGGTVWSGQANWQYRTLQGQCRWSLDPSAWLRLGAGLKWEWLTDNSRLSGRILVAPGRWQLDRVQGSVGVRDLKAMLPSLEIAGGAPLSVMAVDLNRRGDAWQGSSGQLEWEGGALQYLMEGQKQAMNLPPVRLTITGQEQRLQLELVEQAAGSGLATFVLNGDMLESRLRQRLLAHAPGYRGVAEPDAVVVTASQPLSSL